MDALALLFYWPAIKETKSAGLLLLVVFMPLLTPSSACAHSVFDSYIHHRIDLKIDPNNIDVTVELFFHAHQSESERRLMDSDGNGHIISAEIRRYLKLKTGQFKNGLQLSIDGRSVPVMILYRPDLKLHNVDLVGDHPHSLKLYYFVRTPCHLLPGSAMTLKDILWPTAPASGGRIFYL